MIAIDILLKFMALDGICTLSHLVRNLKQETLQPNFNLKLRNSGGGKATIVGVSAHRSNGGRWELDGGK